MTGIMATITVYREYGAPLLQRMRVYVDDTLVAALGSDSSVDIDAPAGGHSVRVTMGLQASAPVEVDLEPEDSVHLRGDRGWRAHSLTGTLRRPYEALDLEVMTARPRTAPTHTERAELSDPGAGERLNLTKRSQRLLVRAVLLFAVVIAPLSYLSHELGAALAR